MRKVLKMSNDEMAKVFEEWNSTELNSYLIEITYKILAKKDETDGTHIVDYVLDKTGMKGTGRWTVQEAAEQSVAAPTIAASLDTRYISARKDERVKAANILEGPIQLPTVDKEQVLTDLKNALYCSKIVSYAQGMNIIRAASDKKEWGVDLAQCALMWRGGCIIRADLLGKIQNAFTTNPDLPNLMVDPAFAAELNSRHMAWRRIVGLGVASGIGCPTLCTSLTYYDQYRRESLPANLVQAQRDFFGGHTYERVDKEGTFHTAWTDAHKDLGDLSGRTAGNV